VAIKNLGTKLVCSNCEARFYDLNKKSPICPKCDSEYVAVKPRTRKTAVKVKPITPVIEETPKNSDLNTEDNILEGVEVEVDEDEDEEDDDVIENTSDIGDDDEDMADFVNIGNSSDEVNNDS
jgi:uncharacterized protein (TIGR02300 family)